VIVLALKVQNKLHESIRSFGDEQEFDLVSLRFCSFTPPAMRRLDVKFTCVLIYSFVSRILRPAIPDGP